MELLRYALFLLYINYINSVYCHHDQVTEVGFSPSSRAVSDSLSDVSLIVDKNTAIDISGKVIAFNYYSNNAGHKLKFQVWRSPNGGSSYTLIHQTQEVTTEGTGSYTYTCTKTEEFFVQSGDVIGVGIVSSSPLTYSVVDCGSMSFPVTSSGSAEEGDHKSFSDAASECRQYSLQADVLYDTADAVSLSCSSLTAQEGFKSLTSPGYDGTTLYEINIHQCWSISVDSTLLEENDRYAVQLEIVNFDLEDPYASGECNGDALEVKDGSNFWGFLLSELCGSSVADMVNGTDTSMYLRMFSDDNDLTVATGFNLQYRAYLPEEASSVNVLLIVGIVIAVVIVAAIVVVILFWFRLKRKRDNEYKAKLKDNEVNGITDEASDDDLESAPTHGRHKRTKSANRVSPDMLRREKSLYANPTAPKTKINAHKDADLKGHLPKDERIPDASQYQAPRKQKHNKHWSRLGAGVSLDG